MFRVIHQLIRDGIPYMSTMEQDGTRRIEGFAHVHCDGVFPPIVMRRVRSNSFKFGLLVEYVLFICIKKSTSPAK